MYQNIYINGQPVQRVISNGQTIWSKVPDSFITETEVATPDVDFGSTFIYLMDPLPEGTQPSDIDYIDIEYAGRISGDEVSAVLDNGLTLQLTGSLSDHNLNPIEAGETVVVQFK